MAYVKLKISRNIAQAQENTAVMEYAATSTGLDVNFKQSFPGILNKYYLYDVCGGSYERYI